MNIFNCNWYLVSVLTVILIALIIDRKRVMSQNYEWYCYNILSKADIDTIIGKSIVMSCQRHEPLEAILKEVFEMITDDERQVKKVYGEYYDELITIIKMSLKTP